MNLPFYGNGGNPNETTQSSSSDSFFSPISMAFFGGRSGRDGRSDKKRSPSMILPKSHDNSWIGARQSPIPSFDNEDSDGDDADHGQQNSAHRPRPQHQSRKDDDDRATEMYHRALHESLEAANFVVNEQTSLLRKQKAHASPIHPLWHGASTEERKRHYQQQRLRPGPSRILWGDVLIVTTGLSVLVASAYEMYQWYVQEEEQQEDQTSAWKMLVATITSSSAWVFSVLKPRSEQTLLYMGAFSSERVLLHSELWRIPSSMLLCASFSEWLLLFLSWALIGGACWQNQRPRNPRWAWMGLFFATALVGQLWTLATWTWETAAMGASSSVSTCAIPGICGVLVAVGMHQPEHRLLLFLPPMAAILLALWEEPCSSVSGVTGACFFGWGLAVTQVNAAALQDAWSAHRSGFQHDPWSRRRRPGERFLTRLWAYICQLFVLALVLIPVLFISFSDTPSSATQ